LVGDDLLEPGTDDNLAVWLQNRIPDENIKVG
jgi:hypothetical protein